MARRKPKELSMQKIREVLRLAMQSRMSSREIGKSCNISHSTVQDYVRRVQKAQVSYEQIEQMDDQRLRVLLQRTEGDSGIAVRPHPDWAHLHQELKKKGVTLQLLWEEYKEDHPDGYQPSQFYEHYGRWRKKLSISMRQTHKAGEKMFVDYAGQTIAIQDRYSGKTVEAHIFVAVLGASNYTFAEASLTQSLEDWINSHIHAYEYFGGVSMITVPDNLKSGVSKPCRYEPEINPTYHDMANHYGTAIIPARVVKPKDKAKVEVGVQIVERWILARLRNRVFFSLRELNQAIRELLVRLNTRPFKKLEGTRASWYESLEKPALHALPQERYVLTRWKKAKVNIDYHVELLCHYYSVPYMMRGQEVYICYTTTTVEIFHNNTRVASHARNDAKGRHTTVREHMPKSHQQYLEWSPSRIIHWAQTVGTCTATMVETILNVRLYPEQGYRSCLGIMRLGKDYSFQRLESACARALKIGGHSYKSVRSILENGLDQQPVSQTQNVPVVLHENIRGQNYF